MIGPCSCQNRNINPVTSVKSSDQKIVGKAQYRGHIGKKSGVINSTSTNQGAVKDLKSAGSKVQDSKKMSGSNSKGPKNTENGKPRTLNKQGNQDGKERKG